MRSVFISIIILVSSELICQQVTNTINFTADISEILGVGIGGAFDPANDTLMVMGLDWGGLGVNVQGDSVMVQDPFNAGIYTATLTVTSGLGYGVGDSTWWKFKASPDSKFTYGGWENIINRLFFYQQDGSTINLPVIKPRIYPLRDIIASDVSISITVDMSDPVNFYNGEHINPWDLEFVGMKGGADFLGNWQNGNWTPEDTLNGSMKVLYDQGNFIWGTTIVIPGGTQNGGFYEYKFAMMYPGADTVNGGFHPLDNENSWNLNHGFMLIDNPNIEINNVFGDMGGDDIYIVLPNGGESLLPGEVYEIFWLCSSDHDMKIEYSVTNGVSWKNVVSSTPNVGTYRWTVPNEGSFNCKLRITDLVDNSFSDISDSVFTIGEPTINVTSPNGGEIWPVMSEKMNITWTSNVELIRLEYTTDNGTTWLPIIAPIPASNGSYSWSVLNTPSEECRIKISDYSNPDIFDISDSVFSIVVPIINITSPIGGENWIFGNSNNITWTSSFLNGLRIQYTTDNGTSWINVIASTPASNGSYNWIIPNTPSTLCRVKIIDFFNSNRYDISDSLFTIVAPTITVTTPNGGESMIIGSIQQINWISSNINDVTLQYTTDDGINWLEIISSTSALSGSYNWTVPNTSSTQCRIRILDYLNPNFYDISDNVFAIVIPALIIMLPNGGENWLTESEQDITWTINYSTNVKINYTTNNGTSWINIIDSIPSSIGIFSWTVPNTPSTQCRMKITDLNNPLVFDAGDNLFTVFSYPTTVTINNSITFGSIFNTANYRIVGFPGDFYLPVSQPLTGNHPYDWNVYWDTGEQSNYQIQYNGSSTFNFSPGKAFWILSKNPFSVSTQVNTVSLSSDNTYTIPLHNSWNLIAIPFERSVKWSDVKSANSLGQNQNLYSWEGGPSFITPLTDMMPYKGYYFNNNTNRISLKIPYNPNGSLEKESLHKKNATEYPVDISGMLSLKLLKENEATGTEVFVGINPESKEGYDEWDYYCAPGDFQEVRLSLVRKELPPRDKYFYIEQRSEIGEGQEYDIEVKTIPNQEIKLSAEGLENFEGYEIYLLDSRLNNLYNLREKRELELVFAHQINEMKLFIGKTEYIEKKKNELQPLTYQLYQNYPNPFNPKTVIRFSLPEKNTVTLTVYSILGELVTTLIDNQEYEAGNYEVEFDGSEISSGVYVNRLQAGSFQETKKMVMMK